MAYTLACRDLGADCPYVARGETIDEVIQDGPLTTQSGM